VAAAPAGFPNALAQRFSAKLDRGSKAAQVRKGRGFSLRPDESSGLDTPAQHHDLIARLDLIQQAAQAFPRFPDAYFMYAHTVTPCRFEVYRGASLPRKESLRKKKDVRGGLGQTREKAALPPDLRKASGFPAQTATVFPLGTAGRLSLPAVPRAVVRMGALGKAKPFRKSGGEAA
jgi:hypothetical protein